MTWPSKLLRIDSLAGLSVGCIVLLLHPWLASWYQLGRDFMLFMALVNIAYGCYSLTLSLRLNRPMALIALLVVANMGWALLCLRWVFIFAATASFFGLAHLLLEALFVGSLACLEWVYRDHLRQDASRL